MAGNPLASLTNKAGTSKGLTYPSDLGSAQKNHYILFNVFKTTNDTTNPNAQSDALNFKPQTEATPNQGAVIGVDYANLQGKTGVAPGATSIPNNQAPIAGQKDQPGFSRWNIATPTTWVPGEQIALYIPDEVSLNENAQYGQASFIDALGDLSGQVIKKASSYIDKGGSALLRLGLNYLGYVFNPQEQLMFEGIDFRKFNMSFTFTPSSKEEADAVREIIKTFRKNAAPNIGGILGFFYIPPSQFMITYCSGNGSNQYIHQFKRSVLEDITVNYAPNGWSAHSDDYSPVQTTISLTFKELELVTREDIEKGY